jgi:hypothetical protein
MAASTLEESEVPSSRARSRLFNRSIRTNGGNLYRGERLPVCDRRYIPASAWIGQLPRRT